MVPSSHSAASWTQQGELRTELARRASSMSGKGPAPAHCTAEHRPSGIQARLLLSSEPELAHML